jgi:transcriptional repressor NF-X1
MNCGNHECKLTCHEGPCPECPYTPEKTSKCCCGRMDAATLGLDNRKSCLDPIPICGLTCGKALPCGHSCKKSCHPGECPQCTEMVVQTCRCQRNERKIECWKTLFGDASERLFLCERPCRKLLSCKKHKCQRLCCGVTKGNDPEGVHLCLKVCDKPLSCGNH